MFENKQEVGILRVTFIFKTLTTLTILTAESNPGDKDKRVTSQSMPHRFLVGENWNKKEDTACLL